MFLFYKEILCQLSYVNINILFSHDCFDNGIYELYCLICVPEIFLVSFGKASCAIYVSRRVSRIETGFFQEDVSSGHSCQIWLKSNEIY